MIVNFTTKRLCIASLLSIASFSVNAQNSSVVLNGTSQYIDAGNNALLDAPAIRTMEAWVKFNSFAGIQEILSRSTNSSGIELLIYNNELNFFCMQSPANVSYVHAPLAGLNTGTWYHIAAAWDGSTKESMRLYINGVSVGVRSEAAGNINLTGITNPAGTFRIGEWSDAGQTRYLAGTVDEVRVWSINRTAAEIKAGMYDGIANNTAGLSAYYRLNDGAGTTATNSATSGAALNGALINTPAWATSPVQKLENGLNFDGSNDQVAIPANAAFDLTAGGTIEMWVQPSALSATPATLLGNRGAGGIRYSFDITTAGLGFRNNSARLTVANAFTNGTWYHLAFVYDGAIVTAYVNGALAGTFSQAISTGITGQAITLGIGKTSGVDVEPYAGNMDEVRIWNTQRTQTQIQNNMGISVNGAATGLVAVYGFNQGIANGANAGMLIAEDRTANNFHGSLVNFAVTGATSNWTSTTALALPVNLTYFAGARDNDKVVLNWETAQEQNSRDFSIERSTDGVNYTAIGSLPAAGNSTMSIAYSFTDYAPEAGTNYYRLLQTDINGQFKYSKTVTIKFPLIAGMKIAPNPAVGTVYYTVNGLRQSQASVSITDMNGKKMLVRAITLQQGINRLNLDVSALPAGNYTLQVTNTAIGQQTTERLVIVR
jgi:hypothetical protein